jgi:hypothetical protein
MFDVRNYPLVRFVRGVSKLARQDYRQRDIEGILMAIISQYEFEVEPMFIIASRTLDHDTYLENEAVVIDQFSYDEGIVPELEQLYDGLQDFRSNLYDRIEGHPNQRRFLGKNGKVFLYELFEHEGPDISIEILMSVAGLGRIKKGRLVADLHDALLEVFRIWFNTE